MKLIFFFYRFWPNTSFIMQMISRSTTGQVGLFLESQRDIYEFLRKSINLWGNVYVQCLFTYKNTLFL